MAGGKGGAFDTALLALIFNATSISGLAENDQVSPLMQLWFSLHLADPGVAGNQTTQEAAYASYTRISVIRNGAGFQVSGNQVSPLSVIQFPTATAGSETETWWAVGTAQTGTGMILYRGPLSPPILVTAGVAPQLTTNTIITES